VALNCASRVEVAASCTAQGQCRSILDRGATLAADQAGGGVQQRNAASGVHAGRHLNTCGTVDADRRAACLTDC
jgi:hypothetical protein